MADLFAWQRAFAETLWSADATACLAGVTGPVDAPMATAVYRHNVMEGLSAALRSIYGSVATLVGDECYRAVSYHYIRATPSREGDLNAYGADFPDHLAKDEALSGLTYLSDVARLEWAAHESLLAPVTWAPGIDGHPSLRLVASPYPIMAIFELCRTPETAGALDLDCAEGETVLLARPGREVLMRVVSRAEAVWYEALICNKTRAGADEAARKAGHGEAVAACAMEAVRLGLLIDHSPGGDLQ